MLKQFWINVRVRFVSVFGRRSLYERTDEEVQTHLALREQRIVESGVPRDVARAQARREFGNTTLIKEHALSSWRYMFVETLLNDIRYGLRALRRTPGFTVTAVLSLALGIGANTAIFRLFDALLYRPLPVRSPQELVLLTQWFGERQMLMLSNRQREAFGASATLEGLCASRHSPITVTISKEAKFAEVLVTSGNCFSLLGVSSAFGRMIDDDDDRSSGALVTVLSYGYWQRQYGADPNIIGQKINLQDRLYTIVGVAPREFTGFEPGTFADMIVPLNSIGGPLLSNPNVFWLRLLGRRKPGVSLEQVQADLTVRASRLAETQPKGRGTPPRLEVIPAGRGFGDVRMEFSLPLRILMGAVGLVLLIACTNLASLLIARASGRRQEIDLRIALGASRRRLFRQLLTESILLSSIGGVLGLGITWGVSPLLVQAMSRGRTPILLDLSLGWRTLAFSGAVSVLTGVVFGSLPALRTVWQGNTTIAQHGTRIRSGSRTWSAVLIASQVAICVTVLVSAALLLGSLRNLLRLDPGFRKDRILLVSLRPGQSGYRGPKAMRLYRDLQQRLSAIQGVESVTISAQPPLGGLAITTSDFSVDSVGPRYFETMRIPLLAGREFTDRDDTNSTPVVVISERVAHRMLPDRNPLGQRLDIFGTQSEVVGVVADAHYQSLRQAAEPMAYRPYTQTGDESLTIGIRTVANPEAIVSLIRRELREIASDVPVFSLKTLEEVVDASLVRERMVSIAAAWFGAFALLIASIGVYGRLSYSVTERTGEIGIRMALGALRGEVVWMFLRDALGLALSGSAIGVPLAVASTHAIRNLLFGLEATDLHTFALILAVVMGAAILASYVPSHRAANIDPVTALRNE